MYKFNAIFVAISFASLALAGCGGDDGGDNAKPEINAADITTGVEATTEFEIDGKITDEDKAALTVEWTVSKKPDGATATVKAKAGDKYKAIFKTDKEGAYEVTISADDGVNEKVTKTIKVTVAAFNNPPELDTLTDGTDDVNPAHEQEIKADGTLTFVATGEDTEDDAANKDLAIAWTIAAVGAADATKVVIDGDADKSQVTIKATGATADHKYTVSVQFTDDGGKKSDKTDITLKVVP